MTLQAFRNTLEVFVNKTTEEGLAAFHRAAAQEKERVVETQRQRSGFAPNTTVVADGIRNAPITSAKRVVVIEYFYWKEIAFEAIRMLEGRGPRRTGRYLESVKVFVDGTETNPAQIPEHFSELVIAPTVPYSRRLEVGKRADGRPFVVQVQPKIVDSVTRQLKGRYGNVATIKTEFRRIDGENTSRARGVRRGRRALRSRRSRGSEMTYPSIVIMPR